MEDHQRADAIEKTTETLTATLVDISGLPVRGFKNSKGRYFMFGPRDRTTKTIYTYRKARVFAEGVAIGRSLRKGESMKPSKIAPLLACGAAVTLLVICAPKLVAVVAVCALTIVVAILANAVETAATGSVQFNTPKQVRRDNEQST